MKKKYIIAVAVSIVLFIGFMLYRSHRKEVEGEAYQEKKTARMIEIANASPRAGLGRVGRALKRYYADHKAYPAALTDLYPDYISSKPFLTEVDWHYEPKGVDFYLSKTTVINDKRHVAYVDNRLRPQMEREIMVARPTPVKRVKPLRRRKPVDKAEATVELSQLAQARKDFFEALSRGQIGVGAVYSPQDDEVKLISTLIPEVLSTRSAVSDLDIERELSRNYLVWKDEGGTLGFGNIQYPSTDHLSIFAIGQWYNLKMPPKGPLPAEERDLPSTGKTPEMLAALLNKRFLVWKDRTGTVGFGNTAYPAGDVETISPGAGWQRLKKGDDIGSLEGDVDRKEADVSMEQKVFRLGNRYLVWKDTGGTIGFGNVQYPRRDLDEILQQGDWQGISPALETDANVGRTVSEDVKRPQEDVASRLGRQYLVWKNEAGTIGFGNAQYPAKGVSAIYRPDQWTEMEDDGVSRQGNGQDPEPAKPLPSGTVIASKLSRGYLVWKDKKGTIGFGNLEYPEDSDLHSVCINGDWHPVSTGAN